MFKPLFKQAYNSVVVYINGLNILLDYSKLSYLNLYGVYEKHWLSYYYVLKILQ